MIEFQCGCGWQLSVADDLESKSARCPGCHKVVNVPRTPRTAVRPPQPQAAAGPWKLVSILALAAAAAAVTLSLVRGGGGSPAPAPTDEMPEAVAKLKQELESRDREIAALKEAKAKLVDPSVAEAEKSALQAENRRLSEDLGRISKEIDGLRTRIAEHEGVKAAAVRDPEPAKAAPSEQKSIAEVVEKCSPAVLIVKTNEGFGAGFFITPEGLAVTNYHVIARSRSRSVAYFEGTAPNRIPREFPAEVVAIDLRNDLALLKAAVNQAVPVAELEPPNTLRVGDEVVAIGNPGLGAKILDYSVSSGIVSSLERELDGTKFLQTTTPINPGNSGGPLFNRAGRVVGVVSAKGVNVENIGFAIPMAAVKTLFDRREGVYAVRGSLAEWEAANGFKYSHDTSRGIPYESALSKIVVDADRDRILGLDFANNGIAVISISKKKLIKNTFTGSDPTDFQPTSNPDVVWVSHIANKSLVKVDVVEGKVLDKFEMPHQFVSFVLSRNHIWTFGGTNLVMPLKDKKTFIVNANWAALAYDRKRDRMLALRGTPNGWGVSEFDPDKVAPILKDIAQLRTERDPGIYRQIQEMEREVDRLMKHHVLPREAGEGLRGMQDQHTILADGSSRVYVNRMSLKYDKLDSVIGILKANPYSRGTEPAIARLIQQFPRLDRILAGSPDTKWISTGTHIYNGERFTVHKELPVPALAVAFTPDSKFLYLYDVLNKVLLPVEIEEKPKDLK